MSIPSGYTGETRAPVVLNLHGAGSTGEQEDALSQLPAKAGDRGYIVVSPDAVPGEAELGNGQGTLKGGIWNIAGAFNAAAETAATAYQSDVDTGDDVGFVNALLDMLEDDLCIDPSRVFSTGISNGGGMTMWLACQTGQRFAAVAPVAGVNMGTYCPGSDMPPLVAFHGDADPAMPYTGKEILGIPLNVPSVDDRMNELAAKHACSFRFTDTPIGADVVHRVWECPPGAALELYVILGGGHTWPGAPDLGAAVAGRLGATTQTIDATDVMLDFFDTHDQEPMR